MGTQITHDPFEADLNRYLHQLDAEDIQAERIDTRSAELYPSIYRETLSNKKLIADLISPEFDLRPIVEAACRRDTEALMRGMRSLIVNSANDYARKEAEKEAELQIVAEDKEAEDKENRASEGWQ